MTTNYNRSQVYDANELNETQKLQVINDFCFEDSDFYSTSYIQFKRNDVIEFLPLNMFMITNINGQRNNFTHGIYSTSAFDGYFITFNKSNDECIIAHKYF